MVGPGWARAHVRVFNVCVRRVGGGAVTREAGQRVRVVVGLRLTQLGEWGKEPWTMCAFSPWALLQHQPLHACARKARVHVGLLQPYSTALQQRVCIGCIGLEGGVTPSRPTTSASASASSTRPAVQLGLLCGRPLLRSHVRAGTSRTHWWAATCTLLRICRHGGRSSGRSNGPGWRQQVCACVRAVPGGMAWAAEATCGKGGEQRSGGLLSRSMSRAWTGRAACMHS